MEALDRRQRHLLRRRIAVLHVSGTRGSESSRMPKSVGGRTLSTIGAPVIDLSPIIVDGVYNPQTRAATRQFQHRVGLSLQGLRPQLHGSKLRASETCWHFRRAPHYSSAGRWSNRGLRRWDWVSVPERRLSYQWPPWRWNTRSLPALVGVQTSIGEPARHDRPPRSSIGRERVGQPHSPASQVGVRERDSGLGQRPLA